MRTCPYGPCHRTWHGVSPRYMQTDITRETRFPSRMPAPWRRDAVSVPAVSPETATAPGAQLAPDARRPGARADP